MQWLRWLCCVFCGWHARCWAACVGTRWYRLRASQPFSAAAAPGLLLRRLVRLCGSDGYADAAWHGSWLLRLCPLRLQPPAPHNAVDLWVGGQAVGGRGLGGGEWGAACMQLNPAKQPSMSQQAVKGQATRRHEAGCPCFKGTHPPTHPPTSVATRQKASSTLLPSRVEVSMNSSPSRCASSCPAAAATSRCSRRSVCTAGGRAVSGYGDSLEVGE